MGHIALIFNTMCPMWGFYVVYILKTYNVLKKYNVLGSPILPSFHHQFQQLRPLSGHPHLYQIQPRGQAVQIKAEQTGCGGLRQGVLLRQGAPGIYQAHRTGQAFGGGQVEPGFLGRRVGRE